MVGEGNSTAGASGSGNNPGSGQGAGDEGAGGTGGDRQPGAGAGSDGRSASSLDRTRLNPMLRGMDEDQLNEVFDSLFTAARAGRDSGVPGHAREETPRVEVPKPPDKDALKAMFDVNSEHFDPQAAIDQIVTANYGGLLSDINTRSLSAVEVSIAQIYPDYMEYKGDINKILAGRAPATISQNDLVGAYIMARGAKLVTKEMEERKKPPTTRPPSASNSNEDGAPPSNGTRKLTSEEEGVARIMFRSSPDPIKAFREAEAKALDFNKMKVPGDPA